MTRWRALLLYLALSVPFGIAAHLGSEFAGLGRDADDLAFSPLHGYLALTAIGALVAFLVAGGFFSGRSERYRRLALMARALPFEGRGYAFFGLSVVLQFAFFVVTQLGEGCPLCKGDVLVGVAAALIASLIGAWLVNLLRRRLVAIVAAIETFLTRRCDAGARRHRPRYATRVPFAVFSTFAVSLANRPPPARS